MRFLLIVTLLALNATVSGAQEHARDGFVRMGVPTAPKTPEEVRAEIQAGGPTTRFQEGKRSDTDVISTPTCVVHLLHYGQDDALKQIRDQLHAEQISIAQAYQKAETLPENPEAQLGDFVVLVEGGRCAAERKRLGLQGE